MKRIFLRLLVCTLFCDGVFSLLAQGEKTTLLLLPKPDQSSDFRMVQDIDLDMTFEGELPGQIAAAGPFKMRSKTVLAFTQKNGHQNSEGGLESEMTYTEGRSEISLNGRALPAGAPFEQFVGKKITVTFDRQGKVVDAKFPAELETIGTSLRQTMTTLYPNLPATALAIGESATVPLSFQLPIPLTGPQPLTLGGQTQYKLLAVDKEGADRLAKLSQVIEAQIAGEQEIGEAGIKGKIRIDGKMSGSGKLELNLDKSIMKANETQTNVDAKLTITGDLLTAKNPIINLRGTIKMTMTGSTP